jgi:hypothetical protein
MIHGIALVACKMWRGTDLLAAMRVEGAVVGFGFEVGTAAVEDDFVEFEFVGGAVGFAREAAGAGVPLRELW